jgi:hypothetical protein
MNIKYMHRVGRVLSFSPVVRIRNWDYTPTPHLQASASPRPGSGRRGTLAGERGGGRVPILTRGHTLWYSLYCTTYFVSTCLTCFPTTLGMLVLCMIYAVGNGFSPPPTQNGVKREANRIFSWGCVSGLCMEHVSPRVWNT